MSTTSSLPINKVVQISVASAPTGLSDFRVNNLLYATKEAPVNPDLGDYTIYFGPDEVGDDWGLSSETYQAAVNIFSQQPNLLAGNGVLIIAAMTVDDTLASIYADISKQIYFGAMLFGGYQPDADEMAAGASAFEAAGVILFLSSNDTSLLNSGGAFYNVQAARETFARCLLYTVNALQARLFAAAYAARGMATNWDGAATASTQQLKDLVGVLPDPGITSTLSNTCETVGVDYYTNIGGLPKLFSTGGNTFFDQVWGTLWLKNALQVAGFNALATTPTKIPQTEPGIALLRNAYTAVLERGVRNGFIAPGTWNSPTTFGNPQTLIAAVLALGYFVYSIPVALQSQTARAARQAPPISIAVKLAGAVHSSNVIVYIEP